MKVLCISNCLGELDHPVRSSVHDVDVIRSANADHPPITVGKEYLVYGISHANGNLWYDIVTDPLPAFTISILAVFFRVVDPSVSRHWEFHPIPRGGFRLRPASWVANPYYQDELTDGIKSVVDDFNHVRGLIEKEESERTPTTN